MASETTGADPDVSFFFHFGHFARFFAIFETMGSDPDVSFLATLQAFLKILKQWGLTPMFHF